MQPVMHLLRSACGLSAAHASFFTFLGSTWRQAHCCFGMAVWTLSEMKLTNVAVVPVELLDQFSLYGTCRIVVLYGSMRKPWHQLDWLWIIRPKLAPIDATHPSA